MQLKQEEHLYEFSTIRYVPRVEREEFVNVGLIMMCKRGRWIRSRVKVDEKRLSAFSGETDFTDLARQLDSFLDISQGVGKSPIAKLETHERFRWLTAVRSASIATSRPHPGKTPDLEGEFEKLWLELVE